MNSSLYQRLVFITFLVFLFGSCKKYLDIQPRGMQLLKTVNDFDLWLNNSKINTAFPGELDMLADNYDQPTTQLPLTSIFDRVYTWQAQFAEDQFQGQAAIWKDVYEQIYHYNTVISQIDDATDGTEDQKKGLVAEARLGRAFSYLYLVNLYGKPYHSATASQDLAVPFVISNDLNDDTPPRSTVQDIYDNIISDLTIAVPDLPADNSANRFRGSVSAAYSLLARTYLYMGDYQKAAINARLALDNGPNTIVDYTSMTDARGITNLTQRPDAIYARTAQNAGGERIPTLEFLRSFNKDDLRLKFFYVNLGDYSFDTRGEVRYRGYGAVFSTIIPNWGTSVAEMTLILAEAAARANDLPAALNYIEELRIKRFPADVYIKYESASQEEVVQAVFKERNFEFPYSGMRWIDMRRLNAENKMPEVTRTNGAGDILATLSPGSSRYTLQIPVQVMFFNPGWQQNP